jgi:hypothetical protein
MFLNIPNCAPSSVRPLSFDTAFSKYPIPTPNFSPPDFSKYTHKHFALPSEPSKGGDPKLGFSWTPLKLEVKPPKFSSLDFPEFPAPCSTPIQIPSKVVVRFTENDKLRTQKMCRSPFYDNKPEVYRPTLLDHFISRLHNHTLQLSNFNYDLSKQKLSCVVDILRKGEPKAYPNLQVNAKADAIASSHLCVVPYESKQKQAIQGIFAKTEMYPASFLDKDLHNPVFGPENFLQNLAAFKTSLVIQNAAFSPNLHAYQFGKKARLTISIPKAMTCPQDRAIYNFLRAQDLYKAQSLNPFNLSGSSNVSSSSALSLIPQRPYTYKSASDAIKLYDELGIVKHGRPSFLTKVKETALDIFRKDSAIRKSPEYLQKTRDLKLYTSLFYGPSPLNYRHLTPADFFFSQMKLAHMPPEILDRFKISLFTPGRYALTPSFDPRSLKATMTKSGRADNYGADLKGVCIAFSPGMDNTYLEAKANLMHIKGMSEDPSVKWLMVHNQTNGKVLDIAEIIFLNHWGISPNTAKEMKKLFTQFHLSNYDNQDLKLLYLAHSQANYHIFNALKDMPKEITDRIFVIQVAPAKIVYKEMCFKIERLICGSDFVPMIQHLITCAKRCFIEMPESFEGMFDDYLALPKLEQPEGSLSAHSFQDITYLKDLKDIIKAHINLKGMY